MNPYDVLRHHSNHKDGKQAGFTLIELMVVVAIIGIIAALSAPSFRIAMLEGRLQDAKPYLMKIAAAERSYLNRNGSYFPTTGDQTDEQNIEDTLGVNLKDAADYCFIIRRSSFISNMGSPDFEVWAVIRNSTFSGAGSANDSVTVVGGSPNCTTADEKNDPLGWASESGAGEEGRVLVLRYPPPADGVDSGTVWHRKASGAPRPDWISGFSIRDALLD